MLLKGTDMKLLTKSALVAACLAGGLGVMGTAMAFGPGGGGMGGEGHGMMGGGERHGMHGGFGHKDPAKMQERRNQRLGELKTKLQITAAQEGAWTAFTASMQPPAGKPMMDKEARKKMHDDMQKLTTPERIDRMKAMHAERQAMMDRRAEAVKTLYAALNPEQRKVFDTLPHGGGRMGHRG
jgi:periplasmic protein CpxP/Spy